MVTKAEKKYNPKTVVENVERLWKERDAYKKSKAIREKGDDFYFIDGPPYTSGNIHLGTAWNKILKDSSIRYHRMHGYNVRDQPGFDMHGLPIEVLVEKALDIKNKQQIESLGVNTFIDKCKEFAMKNLNTMTGQFKQLGVWMDWDNPYMTIKNEYITAAWWTIKKADDQDLLSKDLRVLSWCPRCETALAEAELEYKDVRDPSVYIKFPTERPNEYIIIWTTTPWTLAGNLAVAVHPDYNYVRVLVHKDGNEETYIMLEDTHEKVMEEAGISEFMIMETLPGLALSGISYKTPLNEDIKWPKIPGIDEWLHKIVLFDGVEADRSGVVHIAPGFGPEDFEIGKEHGLPPFCPVGTDGKLMPNTGKFAGIHVKKASTEVLGDLNRRNLLLKPGTEEHRYGHCWRCKAPIIYRVTNQWFLKITEVRDKMLKEVDRIKWTPEWIGTGRQRNWVENSRDWCISRQRYWGIPLPIWECDCGSHFVASKGADLKDEIGYKPDMELHRPWVDEIKVKCNECGKLMDRVPDVMDVWLDSAVSSWAQLGYPLKQEEFNRWWPCRWITEGHDQTRGWFYSQMGAGVVAFGRAPYDSVLTHGFTLDKHGKPMSKSLGNSTNPLDVTQKFGVDELRFYLMGASAPWEDLTYSEDGVKNAGRFFNILWNSYYFATTYMELDKFDPVSQSVNRLRDSLAVEDRWILSRLESLKRELELEWPKQHLHKVVRGIEKFVLEDFSRWYVRLAKERAWIEDSQDPNKLAFYATMSHVLVSVSKLMAPMAPYTSEIIYQNLDGRMDSVHMTDWPEGETVWMNPALEKQMALVEKMVEGASNARQKAGIKLRWPLSRIVIHGTEDMLTAAENLQHILASQTNIKGIELVPIEEDWEELDISVEPNLDAIGPVFRQWASRIAIMLRAQDPKHIQKKMEAGEYVLGIEGQKVNITPEMLKFTRNIPEGIFEAELDGGQLYLDAVMTDALMGEAYCREVIRRIQQMRKEADLDVEDLVEVRMMVDDEMSDLLMEWGEHIAEQTRANLLEFWGEPPEEGYVVEWNIDGHTVTISIIGLIVEKEEEPEPAIEEETPATEPASDETPTEPVAEEAAEETSLEEVSAEPVPVEEEAPTTAEEIATEGTTPEPASAETPAESAPKEKKTRPKPLTGPAPGGFGGEMEPAPLGGTTLSPSVTSQSLTSSLDTSPGAKKNVEETQAEDQTPVTAKEAPVEELPASEPEAPAERRPATPADIEAMKKVLMQVKGVGKKKVSGLIESGFDSIHNISIADPKDLTVVKGINKKMAKNIIAAMQECGETGGTDTMCCPICNSPVGDNDVKCPKCNTHLEGPDESEEQIPPPSGPAAVSPELVMTGGAETAEGGTEAPEEEEQSESNLFLVSADGSSRKKAFLKFREYLKKGRNGLCISKDYPDKIRKKHAIMDCRIFWLSDSERDNSIPAKNLEKINFVVEKFFKEGNGVVILDGIEYLSTNNSMKNVLRLVHTIRDQACIHGGIVILPVDNEAIGPKNFNKLKDEVDEIL